MASRGGFGPSAKNGCYIVKELFKRKVKYVTVDHVSVLDA